MKPKAHLIYNPAAGKGHAGKIFPQVQSLLQKHGFACAVTLTESPGHAQRLSRELTEQGCPLVVAAGGDGTINEVINGLMQARQAGCTGSALGVLPVGRGNDFAFGAGIPLDLENACLALSHDKRCSIDIGWVEGEAVPEGRFFGNGLGLGFDAVANIEASKMKRLGGVLSYLLAIWNTIWIYSKAPVYEVYYDDHRVQKPFLMISAMIGRRLGGMFLVAPQGKNSDGVFDICFAGHVSQLGILGVVPMFIQGTQEQHPECEIVRAKKLRIRAVEGSIPAHADGEVLCTAGHELSIEIVPSALQVVTQMNGSCA
jgi:diacylglycerol kinase (ATP)